MRNILLSLILKSSGRDVFAHYKKFKKQEYLKPEEFKKIQTEQLRKIISHAYKHVPYYRNILEQSGVVENNEIHLEQWHRIKPLTKDILRVEFENLKSTDTNGRKPFMNTSGGSTGSPVKFIQDNDMWTQKMAAVWVQNSFIAPFPCKQVKLWGSERDVLKGGIGWKAQLKNWIYRRKILNSFNMTPQTMSDYVNIINDYKPEIIEGYVQSLYELAKFIEKNNLTVYSPKGIISAAGTLYEPMREVMERVFHTKVFNRYGGREAGGIACECVRREGLHLNTWNYLVEILDDDLKPVEPGDSGKIYVTTLTNFSMPLIRYRIGDMGTAAEKGKEICSCGRGMPLIKSIEGRETNVFRTREGKIIPGEFFIHFLGVVHNQGTIEKFQVIQEDYEKIRIKYITKTESKLEDSKIDIEKSIRKVMGEKCEIIWERTDDIAPLPNGKYIYTLSYIR